MSEDKKTGNKELLEMFSKPETLEILKEGLEKKWGNIRPEQVEMVEKYQSMIAETKRLNAEIGRLSKLVPEDWLTSIMPIIPILYKQAQMPSQKKKKKRKKK